MNKVTPLMILKLINNTSLNHDLIIILLFQFGVIIILVLQINFF